MNKNLPNFKKRLSAFKYSSEIKMVAMECVLFALGFFLTPVKFIFDIRPFGIALVASCKTYALFTYVGSLVAILFRMDGDLTYLFAISALFALRVAASLLSAENRSIRTGLNMEGRRELIFSFFSENVGVRVSLCAFCSMGIGIYQVLKSELSYYEIFVLIFFTVISALLCIALCGLYEGKGSLYFPVGVCALVFTVIYTLRDIEIFSIDISIVLSYAIILYASKNISPSKSGALGALLGICQKIAFAPIFAIASLISGFLWRFSTYLAIMCAFIVSVGYGIFTSGYEAIVYIVPELLFSSLIMYPVLRFEVLPRPVFATDREDGVTVSEILSRERDEKTKKSFKRVSDSLKEISKMLYDLGNSERVITVDSRYDSCLRICESNCYSCPKRSICWERDSSTTKENIDKMSIASFYNKSVEKSDIDEKFLHRCPNIDTIIEKINEKCRDEENTLIKNDKFEISGKDYENISRMIDSAICKIDTDDTYDEASTDKVRRCLDLIGFRYGKIRVFGDVKKRIIATGVDIEASKCNTATLVSSLERALSMKISPPEFEGASPYAIMTSQTLNKYEIESAKISGKTENEDQNGDTVSTFLSSDNKFYMLICDGMGTGKEASFTSKMCADFIKKLLLSHPDKEISLAMANNFIRNKNLECSSSVDLLEIDLADGKSSFIKSGAAPSFVKRGDKVFKLHSKTAPIGIMKNLDAEQLDFILQENDTVVMVSDGVCQDERDAEWIMSLLSSADLSPSSLPQKILARCNEKGLKKDDRSICVATVHSAVV